MPTCARSPARAEGRMAPSTRQHSRARRQGVPQLMHILNAAKLTRLEHVARMPNGSVVKQLLFAEGLVGLGGVVGRPLCTEWDRAVAALSLVLTPRLAGWGCYGLAQDHAQRRSHGDSVQLAV
eukprot:364467-Chlamydomonas_euryale.AAC.7